MRIGVATFSWADNYGALLQTYAMQQFLKNRGHHVEIIDFRPRKRLGLVRSVIGRDIGATISKWKRLYRVRVFEGFRRDSLEFSPVVWDNPEGHPFFRDRYDLVVSGSDQVFNPRWIDQIPGIAELCLLDFCGERTRRLSFAASFGFSQVNAIGHSAQNRLAKALARFDGISVREESGIKIVRELSGRLDAVCLADPTLLQRKEWYFERLKSRRGGRGTVFAYLLHGYKHLFESSLRELAYSRGKPLAMCDGTNVSFPSGVDVLPHPLDWLNWIRDASLVVTNSFHCTVFCMLFDVPFLFARLQGEDAPMNDRVIELSRRFQLDIQEIDSPDALRSKAKWTRASDIIGEVQEELIRDAEAFLNPYGI